MKTPKLGISLCLLFSLILTIMPQNSLAENYSIHQSTTTVKGKVTDSDKIPLPGVVITLKGHEKYATTDSEGNFTMNDIFDLSSATLVFTCVGMITQEVALKGKTVINVILKDNIVELGEVVAIGYGSIKKSDLTGAVSSVKGDKLTQTSSRDVLSGLQGKMSGVNITLNSGAPGESATVRIRGVGTINNSNPIYVVDGFQISDINYLGVNDIENIEVLKDASATSIYGSRGANGVILITTKKGGKDQLHINGSYSIGFQSASKKIDMLNAWQFATLYREAYANSNVSLSATDDAITQYVIDNHYKGTDWQDKVFREMTPVHNAELSLSGSSGKNSYLLSLLYTHNEGLVQYNDYSRFNVRFYNNYELSKHAKLEADISYSTSQKHNINGSVLTSALYMDPIAPAWNENTNNYGSKTFNQIEATNPALLIDNSRYDNMSDGNRLVANFALSFTDLFVKDLSLTSRFGYDKQVTEGKGFYPEYYVDQNTYNQESSLYESYQRATSWLWSNYLSYNKKSEKHSIDGMIGMEMQKFTNKYAYGIAYDVPYDPNQQYFDLAGNQERKGVRGNYSESALLSFFARANYKFLDRYLLTATIRSDGSSKFVGSNRWGFFPSVAIAWDIKKENFLANVDIISALKLRAGWGIVGNQNSLSNPYVYASTITSQSNNYVLNNTIVNGYYPAELANKDIKWESTETFNIGLDFFLFNNRVDASLNIFQNTTRDMIATPLAPMYVGYNAVPSNIGSMRNRGIEFSLGYKQHIRDFFFDVNWNITSVKNKVLSLGTSTAIRAGNLPRLDPTTYTDVGTEIGAFYGLATQGIFTQETLDKLHAEYPGYQPTAQPGDVWFVDANNDHRIDKNDDRQYLGSAIPDFTSGLNIYLKWKNFDLNCYLLGSYGNEIVNGQYVYINGSNIKSNWSARMWNRSTKDNITNVPRLDVADINGNTSTFSDLFVEDGSYLRMKNIQIGYNLSKEICQKMKMSDIRFYVSADNLFTITGYTGWDPEPVSFGTLNGGVDYGTYPLSRVISFGANIKF